MADQENSFIGNVHRAIDDIELNMIRQQMLAFQEDFSSLRDDYDIVERGLILDSPTLNRIKDDKYHAPFDEAVNISSRDERRVQEVIRENEGTIWPLQ